MKIKSANTMIARLLRPFRNWHGNATGRGACDCCGDSYGWKQPHVSQYSKSTGSLICCEECWETKSDIEIIWAAEKFAAERLQRHYSKESREEMERMVAFVHEEVKMRRKQEA